MTYRAEVVRVPPTPATAAAPAKGQVRSVGDRAEVIILAPYFDTWLVAAISPLAKPVTDEDLLVSFGDRRLVVEVWNTRSWGPALLARLPVVGNLADAEMAKVEEVFAYYLYGSPLSSETSKRVGPALTDSTAEAVRGYQAERLKALSQLDYWDMKLYLD